MAFDIVFVVIGIALVMWGASRLTDGAVAIAARLKVPQLVIGLTVVALGTSLPEFCVSFVSALKGTPDLALGNVIGSNIFNVLLIVGCTAVVTTIPIPKTAILKDIPFAVIASAVLVIMVAHGNVSRLDAMVLFLLFLLYMYMTLRGASGSDDGQPAAADLSPLRSVVYVLLGLFGLIVGSDVFVDGATSLAQRFHVSDAVIGLTVVAGGTSLPELATSIVAAKKGNAGISIGNVIGSNVFNILMILGITGLICPMQVSGITSVDLSLLLGSIILLWMFSFFKSKIERWQGIVFLMIFLAYMTYLLMNITSTSV